MGSCCSKRRKDSIQHHESSNNTFNFEILKTNDGNEKEDNFNFEIVKANGSGNAFSSTKEMMMQGEDRFKTLELFHGGSDVVVVEAAKVLQTRVARKGSNRMSPNLAAIQGKSCWGGEEDNKSVGQARSMSNVEDAALSKNAGMNDGRLVDKEEQVLDRRDGDENAVAGRHYLDDKDDGDVVAGRHVNGLDSHQHSAPGELDILNPRLSISKNLSIRIDDSDGIKLEVRFKHMFPEETSGHDAAERNTDKIASQIPLNPSLSSSSSISSSPASKLKRSISSSDAQETSAAKTHLPRHKRHLVRSRSTEAMIYPLEIADLETEAFSLSSSTSLLTPSLASSSSSSSQTSVPVTHTSSSTSTVTPPHENQKKIIEVASISYGIDPEPDVREGRLLELKEFLSSVREAKEEGHSSKYSCILHQSPTMKTDNSPPPSTEIEDSSEDEDEEEDFHDIITGVSYASFQAKHGYDKLPRDQTDEGYSDKLHNSFSAMQPLSVVSTGDAVLFSESNSDELHLIPSSQLITEQPLSPSKTSVHHTLLHTSTVADDPLAPEKKPHTIDDGINEGEISGFASDRDQPTTLSVEDIILMLERDDLTEEDLLSMLIDARGAPISPSASSSTSCVSSRVVSSSSSFDFGVRVPCNGDSLTAAPTPMLSGRSTPRRYHTSSHSSSSNGSSSKNNATNYINQLRPIALTPEEVAEIWGFLDKSKPIH